MLNLNKCISTRKVLTNNLPSILERALKHCKTPLERQMIRAIAENRRIRTHEFGYQHGCKSNNYHNISKILNPRLIRKGLVITKYPPNQSKGSWYWYIEPIGLALSNPIRMDLRRTIFRHMESANDE
jgi:hypothetical protein